MTLYHRTLWDDKVDNDNGRGGGDKNNENEEEEEKGGGNEDGNKDDGPPQIYVLEFIDNWNGLLSLSSPPRPLSLSTLSSHRVL